MGKITGGEFSSTVVLADPGTPPCDPKLVIKAGSAKDAENFGIQHWSSYDPLLPNDKQYLVVHLPGQRPGEYCIVPSDQVIPTETPSKPTDMPTAVPVTAVPTQTGTRVPDNSVSGTLGSEAGINMQTVIGAAEGLVAIGLAVGFLILKNKEKTVRRILNTAHAKNEAAQLAMREQENLTLEQVRARQDAVQTRARVEHALPRLITDLGVAATKLRTKAGVMGGEAESLRELLSKLGNPADWKTNLNTINYVEIASRLSRIAAFLSEGQIEFNAQAEKFDKERDVLAPKTSNQTSP